MRKINSYSSSLFISLLFLLFSCSSTDDDSFSGGTDPNPDSGEQKDITAIDNQIAEWMENNDMPGASLAVSKHGKLVYVKGYGMVNKETEEEVTPKSEFRIASVSKLITSAAIMKLVEKGAISMDQKIFGEDGILGKKYGSTPYHKYVTDVKIKHFLHHTAGAWGQDNDPTFWDSNWTRKQVSDNTLDNLPLSAAPGTQFDYSNFGYMILGDIIQETTGMSYEEYVKSEIWDPVGATASYIGGSKLSERRDNEVVYYAQRNQDNDETQYTYTMNLPRSDAAWGWVSTPTDLLRFATAVDGSSSRPDILSQETLETMYTISGIKSNWGWNFAAGWVIGGTDRFWWGSLPGTFSFIYCRGSETCIAFTANSRIPLPNDFVALSDFDPIADFILDDMGDDDWQDIDQFDD